MQHLLVKYSGNWADEMDVEGFRLMTQDVWNLFLELPENAFPYSFCVGTNEEIDYDNKEDFLSEFSVQEITEQEKEVIEKFFGSYNGFFPDGPEVDYVEDDTDIEE